MVTSIVLIILFLHPNVVYHPEQLLQPFAKTSAFSSLYQIM